VNAQRAAGRCEYAHLPVDAVAFVVCMAPGAPASDQPGAPLACDRHRATVRMMLGIDAQPEPAARPVIKRCPPNVRHAGSVIFDATGQLVPVCPVCGRVP
jgi:hypothetical protein